MAQNIYDKADFFEGYSRLHRSVEGLDGAPEWPVLRAMLPKVGGLSIVDLGCGFGWFCRWAGAHGAKQVLGLDLSERMLARARAAGSDEAIAYERVDLDEL
ncbi:MAG: class I SAM-dependent methyltransferase, partial [Mesorhizobium sp.]